MTKNQANVLDSYTIQDLDFDGVTEVLELTFEDSGDNYDSYFAQPKVFLA